MYFKAFEPINQVSGRAILNAINYLSEFKLTLDGLLKDQNLVNLEEDGWYDEQAWLNVLQIISKKYGPNTIFTLGKGVGANLPKMECDFETLLGKVDFFYKKNHINGEVGYFTLENYDGVKKCAKMKMHTPYPPEYGKGVLIEMTRKFKPDPLSLPTVYVEQQDNEEGVYFNISW